MANLKVGSRGTWNTSCDKMSAGVYRQGGVRQMKTYSLGVHVAAPCLAVVGVGYEKRSWRLPNAVRNHSIFIPLHCSFHLKDGRLCLVFMASVMML